MRPVEQLGQRGTAAGGDAADPDTAHATPEVMPRVAKDHDGAAGVYAAALVEGVIRAGDAIALAD